MDCSNLKHGSARRKAPWRAKRAGPAYTYTPIYIPIYISIHIPTHIYTPTHINSTIRRSEPEEAEKGPKEKSRRIQMRGQAKPAEKEPRPSPQDFLSPRNDMSRAEPHPSPPTFPSSTLQTKSVATAEAEAAVQQECRLII